MGLDAPRGFVCCGVAGSCYSLFLRAATPGSVSHLPLIARLSAELFTCVAATVPASPVTVL